MNVVRFVVLCVACIAMLAVPVSGVLGDDPGAEKWEYTDSGAVRWEYTSRPDKVSIATIRGKQFTFPGNIRFYGMRWRLVDCVPQHLKSTGGVQCHYTSNHSNDDLLYFQGFAGAKCQWYLAMQPRHASDANDIIHDKVLMIRGSEGEVFFNTLADGKYDGVMERYYSNGAMRFAGKTRQGAIHGDATAYRPDGTLWWTGVFHNDGLDQTTVRVFGQNGDQEIMLSDEEISEVVSKWRKESTKKEVMSAEQFLKHLPENSQIILGRKD